MASIAEIVTELGKPEYAKNLTGGQNEELRKQLNTAIGKVWPDNIPADLLKSVVADQLASLTNQQDRVLNTLMANNSVPIGSASVRTVLKNMFAQGTGTTLARELQVDSRITLDDVRAAVKLIPTSAWSKAKNG